MMEAGCEKNYRVDISMMLLELYIVKDVKRSWIRLLKRLKTKLQTVLKFFERLDLDIQEQYQLSFCDQESGQYQLVSLYSCLKL